MGRYEEAVILRDSLLSNPQAVHSTYFDVIAEHFKKEEEELEIEMSWLN